MAMRLGCLVSLAKSQGYPTRAKRSAVLNLVQDEPALRAGAASGILD
jgi:hypothetical protein